MSSTLVVTILGSDRPGLVESLARRVAESGGNWEASRLARLAGRFAGVVQVSVPSERVAELEGGLRGLGRGGLQITVERGDRLDGEVRRLSVLSVVGDDRPGILREVSSVLMRLGANIDELETRCESAPMSGQALFRLRAHVLLPTTRSESEVRAALEDLSDDLMVDISATPVPGTKPG